MAALGAPLSRYLHGSTGYDISWPQCGHRYPPGPHAIAVVGVNDGTAFTVNPCLASEAAWAGRNLQVYMNLSSPTTTDWTAVTGPAGQCSASNYRCMAYNYGYNDAVVSLRIAGQRHVRSATWWIDVEVSQPCSAAYPTGSPGDWSCNQTLNTLTVQGALNAFAAARATAGVYTTAYQWQEITGGYVPVRRPLPTWIAGVQGNVAQVCQSHPVAGAQPWMVQFLNPTIADYDEAC